MKAQTLLEVISASHLTAYVDSPFQQRGGMLIVGPPATLKSSFLSVLQDYPNALVLSDLTTQQLIALREDLSARRYVTVAFKEFEKLYQRHEATAANVEGHIRALVEEGFSHAAWEDQRMQCSEARALVLGAMTQGFYSRKYAHWHASGFSRRFLWAHVLLNNPLKVQQAIHQWELIEFDNVVMNLPSTRRIAYTLTEKESTRLTRMIRGQEGQETPLVLLKKIACVLKYKYRRDPRPAWRVLEDFSECLSRKGALMEV